MPDRRRCVLVGGKDIAAGLLRMDPLARRNSCKERANFARRDLPLPSSRATPHLHVQIVRSAVNGQIFPGDFHLRNGARLQARKTPCDRDLQVANVTAHAGADCRVAPSPCRAVVLPTWRP